MRKLKRSRPKIILAEVVKTAKINNVNKRSNIDYNFGKNKMKEKKKKIYIYIYILFVLINLSPFLTKPK